MRSYEDCASYACGGSLAPGSIADLESGGRYLARADGNEEEPRRHIMSVWKDGSSRLATGYSSCYYYLGNLRGFSVFCRILFLHGAIFTSKYFLLPFRLHWILAKTTYTRDTPHAKYIFNAAVDKRIISACVSNSSHAESSGARESNAAISVSAQLKEWRRKRRANAERWEPPVAH